MKNNIDEDIKYLKNYKYDNEVRQAIDNVLSELEEKIEQIKILENNNRVLDISLGRELETHKDTNKELEKYKKAYELETYERQKFIDEIETWKKIAKKLAEVIERKFADKYSGIDVNKYKCKQSILGWARKEVENEKEKR